MKPFGIFFILVGIVWGVIAYNMETTVTVGGETIGSGSFSVYVPKNEVNNLGLMDTRRNHLMFSGLSIIVGVLLFGFGSISRSTDSSKLKKCPFCAEAIQPDAKKCRYCNGDLPESWSSSQAQETIIPPAQPVYSDEDRIVIRMCPACRFTNNGSATVCSRCGGLLPV